MIRVCKIVGTLPTVKNKLDVTLFFKSLMYSAPSFDVELCLAQHEDFNFTTNTVNGLFFEKGKFIRREVPIA